MAGRDRFSIRPGLPSNGAKSSLHAPKPSIKADELVHRLRDASPMMRLVRDEVEISPQALKAASRSGQSHPAASTNTAAPASTDAEPTHHSLHIHTARKAAPTPPSPATSITNPTDPRWVLALRTAESLQGTILGPEKRERLIKIGKLMGLTAFDANLVIAIVQDQARRGYAPEYCPTAGEAQLAMVPLPKRDASEVDARTRRIGIICGVISVLVGVELVVLKWLFS